MGKKPFIVACVPAFNEERTIAKVILLAQRYVDRVVVRHERNLGYGAAVQSLFRRARELGADVLVTLDADGQHFPSEIPNVVKPIVDGVADVVIGSRFVDKCLAYTMPWYRRAGVRFITKLSNSASKHGVKDAQSGFRAYNRKSLEALTLFENGMGVSAEVLINARKHGLRIREVPSTCNYKDVKGSTRNPMRHGADVVMSIVKLLVEDKPLMLLGSTRNVMFNCWCLFWCLDVADLRCRTSNNDKYCISLYSVCTDRISRLINSHNLICNFETCGKNG